MDFHFEDVDGNNWLTEICVASEQEKFVANKDHLLARAYAFRERRSRAFFIMADGTPVGMGLYYDANPIDSYFFSQLFIGAQYQGKGFGKKALELVLETLRNDGKFPKVRLICLSDNAVALHFYKSFGFYEIKRDGEEIFMELYLHH